MNHFMVQVSVFLFKNKKRIRIYGMEGEEEEEEDTLDSSGFSASMDVNSSQIGWESHLCQLDVL